MRAKRSGWGLVVVCGLVAMAFAPSCGDDSPAVDAAVADAAAGGRDAGDGGPVDLLRDQPVPTDMGAQQADASMDQPGDTRVGACNDLVQPSLIAPTVITGRRPASEVETGGTLQDGDYMLTKFAVYDYSAMPGVAAYMVGVNMRILNGVMDTALLARDDIGLEEERLSERMTVTGNKILTTTLCPANGEMEESLFTTNGTMLRLTQDDPLLELEIVIEMVKR